jgi:hypothetical protein
MVWYFSYLRLSCVLRVLNYLLRVTNAATPLGKGKFTALIKGEMMK